MMKIMVNSDAYDDACEEVIYKVKSTIEIDDESCIDDYIAAFVEALHHETFSDEVVKAGMQRWVQDYCGE